MKYGKVSIAAIIRALPISAVLSCITFTSYALPPARRHPGQFQVKYRSEYVLVEFIGTTNITITCKPGEQLLGGGYVLAPNMAGGNDYFPPLAAPPASPRSLAVEASYPSASNSWTVTLFNPDEKPRGQNWHSQARIDCYYAEAPGFPLNMRIASNTRTVLPISEALKPTPGSVSFSSAPYDLQPFEIPVIAPAGAVVTAGGFRTVLPNDRRFTPNAFNLNSYLTASMPLTNGSGKPVGWTVKQYNTATLMDPPVTTAYVLYATTNLSFSTASVQNGAFRGKHFANGEVDARTHCADDQVAVGGGFEFVGTGNPPWAPWLDSHMLVQNSAVDIYNPAHLDNSNGALDPFGGWTTSGMWRYDVGTFKEEQEPNGKIFTTANFRAWHIGVKIPPVYVTVKIDCAPAIDSGTQCAHNGDCLFEDLKNPGHTLKYTLHATAKDMNGAPLTGTHLKWYTGRFQSGSGETFSVTFPFQRKVFRNYSIRVVATDSDGHSATDSIIVETGCVIE